MSNTKNIFEIAAKNKYRFNFRGQISVEDLWDLSVNQLDDIFKNLNAQVKQATEESLLETKTSASEDLDNKIAIIKHIVASKIEVANKIKNEREIREKRQKIQELLSQKENEELANKSPEELQALLEELK